MADIDKIISGLRACGYRFDEHNCRFDCPYFIPGYTPEYINCIHDMQEDILDFMGEQPVIVRCKDCKKRYTKFCPDVDSPTRADDWFCADGERRTDDA